MIKRIFSMLTLIIILAFSAVPSYTVMAGDKDTEYEVDQAKINSDTTEKGAMKDNLTQIMSPSIWSGEQVATGSQLAGPFVRVIMILATAIVTIVCFMFFFVTALDLAYITVPIMRPLLMKGKEGMAEKSGAKFVCISDSAIEAVNGGSTGGLGGGGDRSVGSCLTKYISSRTVEFTAFVVFCMLFFTGMLSKIVVAIFNIMFGIINAIIGIADGTT